MDGDRDDKPGAARLTLKIVGVNSNNFLVILGLKAGTYLCPRPCPAPIYVGKIFTRRRPGIQRC